MATATNTTEENIRRIEIILTEAKKDRRKGRYYVYEQYKSQLWDVSVSTTLYEQACVELAKALRV